MIYYETFMEMKICNASNIPLLFKDLQNSNKKCLDEDEGFEL